VNGLNNLLILEDYPNLESSEFINPVETLSNSGEIKIVLCDQYGRLIKAFRTIEQDAIFKMNTQNFSPGTYLYHIEAGGKRTAARKLIIK
jgi:hypothetical protein